MSADRREGGDAEPLRWDALPVLVLGLGVSGVACARVLAGIGAAVCAADADDTPTLRERAAALAAAGVDTRLGCSQADLVSGRRLVVSSPGVRPDHPVLVAARQAGVPVWSEPELAWRLAGGRAGIVAVTGTNGKTTTARLLADCLAAPVAGNIGTPLVEVLASADPSALVVAELSSFQLHFADRLRPAVAVLLNLAPDHLDWHGSLDAYAAAKARVWTRQRPVHGGGRGGADWAVVNVDDPGARQLAARYPPPGRMVGFTLAAPAPGRVGVAGGRVVAHLGGSPVDVVGVDELGLPGRHNLANVCAAVAAAVCAGADPAALAAPLRRFRPGPHRLEHVATIDGVAWVDDSKATNPHAAAAALAAIPGPSAAGDAPQRARPSVVWIAGGLGKGSDFAVLADVVRRRVRAAVTIGASGPVIAALTRSLGVPTVEAAGLEMAVRSAAALASAGDTVLLAPACASMDQFRDYAERGRAFRDAVATLARQTGVAGGR